MSTTALMELLQKRKAETGGQKTIKPKAGRNRYRILPGWRGNGDPLFYHDFGQHFIKDAAGQVKAVYICTDRTFGRPCEVCDAVAQAIAMTTDDVTKKRIEESKASGRVLLNVLELEGGNPTVPQILEVPPTVFNGNKGVGGIISLFDEWPNLLDPNTGCDIIIEKSGAGKDTRYGVQVAGGSKPVPAEALTKLNNLDDFVKQESEAAAQRALTQVRAIAGLPAPAASLGYSAAAVAANPYAAQPAPAAWEVDETQLIGGVGAAAPAPAAAPVAPPVAAAVVQPAEVVQPVAAAAPVAPAPVAAPAPAAPVAPVAAAPVAAAPVTAAPAAPAAASTGDPELDALLAGLAA
ncbi:hypothetical protein [Burkholderia vietnamiensis]|uniref:hypothetical protein n=1 Tax=Burkholderia vietnamiensis TaxID=60552 RepID=UPI001CB3AD9A|nr:hypothetical protein [Burkholderia vietnamiensis]CAG9229099.1 hypothetical protein BVI1335_70152 [Burkholderia vietnamiensis]